MGDQSSNNLDLNSENFWEVALKDIESPIQKLSKKAEDLKAFESAGDQEALLLEIAQSVSEFVKLRVTGSAFNAEDERILYTVLTNISRERRFERGYRIIADKLIEELEKPSRRFKVTAEVVLNVRRKGESMEEAEEEEEDN